MKNGEVKGLFVFDGYFQSLKSLQTKAHRWDLFEAMYVYATTGEELPLISRLQPLFLVMKPIIDSHRKKVVEVKSDKEVKGYSKNRGEISLESSEKNLKSPRKVCEKLNVKQKSLKSQKVDTSSKICEPSTGEITSETGDETNNEIKILKGCYDGVKNKKSTTKNSLYNKNENKNINKNINKNEILNLDSDSKIDKRVAKETKENFDKPKTKVDESLNECVDVFDVTLQEVMAFAKKVDAFSSGEDFFLCNEQRGWVDKKGEKIKNWKMAFLSWDKKLFESVLKKFREEIGDNDVGLESSENLTKDKSLKEEIKGFFNKKYAGTNTDRTYSKEFLDSLYDNIDDIKI